jgi:hypothetical protein
MKKSMMDLFETHKKSFCIAIILILILYMPSFSQSKYIKDSTYVMAYFGANINTTGYPIKGDSKYRYFSGITPIINLHYGYKLSKRSTIQVGIGYGANKINGASIRYVSADSVYEEYTSQHVKGIVTPLTFKFNPFSTYNRLQVLVNASLVPIFGHIKAKATESLDGDIEVLYNEESKTFDLVATAGLTVNYKLNNRLDIYLDGLLAYKHFQFQRPDRYYKPRSVGIGINFNL